MGRLIQADKRATLTEIWPCPSLYGHHVPILWWLLPAG